MKQKETLVQSAIEFQPDALELKHSRLPWYARNGALFAFLFLMGALLWSILGKVDVIVQAPGKLVTDKQNIIMKPRDTTVIKTVHVRVGEVVKPDQILITFDPEINAAETERLQSELQTLQAQFDRYLAEFEGRPYRPVKPTEYTAWQKAIFEQRGSYYKEKLNYYSQEMKRLEASLHTNRDSLKKQQERLDAVRKIEQMFENLHRKNASSLKELLENSITRMQMEAEVDKLRNSLVEQEHQRQSLVAERNSFMEEWRNSVSENMVKIQRELVSTKKDYEKMTRMNSYIHLRAPCEAVVHEIAAFPSGSAVREAEPLVTLVPLDGKIELEAEIAPQDIGKVEVGSHARVKLNAFPFQKHGTLDGSVRSISEDTFQRQQGDGSQLPVYYRARVVISGKLERVKPNFRLIPGMEVQTEIKVGRRRIIEYLIYPLIKALDETAREP